MANENNAEKSGFSRQTAIPLSIKDILGAEYVKGDNFDPNHIRLPSGSKVSRINVIAVIVSIPTDMNENVLIDDGSGRIQLRAFDNMNIFKNITIGDIAIIIGKPRVFNNDFYIIPEIIKKVSNNSWIQLRKKELKLKEISTVPLQSSIKDISKDTHNKPLQEKISPKIDVPPPKDDYAKSGSLEIYNMIKEFDNGDGVEIEEIIKKSSLNNANDIITELLLEGEIFEIKPGRLKILG
jgi:RPA family protein